MISDKIIRFHLIEAGLSEEYICLCLNAGETNRHLEQAKSGMAESQMNISQDKLKSAPIPLCPANEQHRIVQKVDELMTLCDQLKERLNQASETRCQLAGSVIEKSLV
jgi:type I restriction enzyme S subunit